MATPPPRTPWNAASGLRHRGRRQGTTASERNPTRGPNIWEAMRGNRDHPNRGKRHRVVNTPLITTFSHGGSVRVLARRLPSWLVAAG